MTASDFREVARLSQIASRMQDLDQQKRDLIDSIEPASAPYPPSSRNVSGTHILHSMATGLLHVEITLKGEKLEICESTASQTMVVLMERLVAAFGLTILERLATYRVSRGPFVSRNPHRDYVNSKTGEQYTSHSIPGTDFRILTHSDTSQKIKNLNKAFQILGVSGRARKS